jgi:type IV pilus assembly protein PilV
MTNSRRMHDFSSTGRGQAGLTLLEIMITLVILSLGLLGLAGLQMTGLKNNRNAYYQTVAAQITQDLAERIKVDQAGVRDGNYDNISQTADSSKCSVANPTVSDRVACLAAALPGGKARVTKRSSSPLPVSFYVALVWNDIQLSTVDLAAGVSTPVAGWGADRPNASPPSYATTACGAPTAGLNCSYAVVMP